MFFGNSLPNSLDTYFYCIARPPSCSKLPLPMLFFLPLRHPWPFLSPTLPPCPAPSPNPFILCRASPLSASTQTHICCASYPFLLCPLPLPTVPSSTPCCALYPYLLCPYPTMMCPYLTLLGPLSPHAVPCAPPFSALIWPYCALYHPIPVPSLQCPFMFLLCPIPSHAVPCAPPYSALYFCFLNAPFSALSLSLPAPLRSCLTICPALCP
jgi:hypothetical protein